VKEIILVSRPGDEDELRELCSGYELDKVTAVIPGGSTRQESSRIGVEAINESSKFVAIHDAARCLITPDAVENVCLTAYDCGAAAAAHRATDTVKICAPDGTVKETVDRNSVWLAATPQVFKTSIYLAGAYMAIRDKIEVTDDCMMAERFGFKVKMVECGSDNIKLTGHSDLAVAEGILSRRSPLKANIKENCK
jgi:2-C-methyl-D-erythritol 4-phosphate cytidylyltransferase